MYWDYKYKVEYVDSLSERNVTVLKTKWFMRALFTTLKYKRWYDTVTITFEWHNNKG